MHMCFVPADGDVRGVPPPGQPPFSRTEYWRETLETRHQTCSLLSLQMVTCEEYRGPAGSAAPGAQPFSVAVARSALLAMDFHAHLSQHEVIGMLGGTFDAAARSMRCAYSLRCSFAFQGKCSGPSSCWAAPLTPLPAPSALQCAVLYLVQH